MPLPPEEDSTGVKIPTDPPRLPLIALIGEAKRALARFAEDLRTIRDNIERKKKGVPL